MRRLVLIALIAPVCLLALPAGQASAKPKHCATGKNFMTGPFFAGKVTAAGTTCKKARNITKQWGASTACIGPGDTCTVGAYFCVTRDVGYEVFKVTCRKASVATISFKAGS